MRGRERERERWSKCHACMRERERVKTESNKKWKVGREREVIILLQRHKQRLPHPVSNFQQK